MYVSQSTEENKNQIQFYFSKIIKLISCDLYLDQFILDYEIKVCFSQIIVLML